MKCKRFSYLIRHIEGKYKNDYWIENYKLLMQYKEIRKFHRMYNKLLYQIDERSWYILYEKLIIKFNEKENTRGKRDFFNTLNEAFAYRYLKRKGYKEIRFINEEDTKKPDIKYINDGIIEFCEVKTVNLSDNEIERTIASNYYGKNDIPKKYKEILENTNYSDSFTHYGRLSEGFFRKLQKDIDIAIDQIKRIGIIYIVVFFDDMTLIYFEEYKKQISDYMHKYNIGTRTVFATKYGNTFLEFSI
jgi:hypothetical protein